MVWPFTLTSTDAAQLDRMVVELKQSIPPDQTTNPSKALSVNKATKVIERVVNDFHVFNKERRMGYFARVRFLHKLEWHLLDAGYAKPFVDVVLEGMLVATVKVSQVQSKP